MYHDFSRNYFELFGLPVSFKLDELRLEQAYREVQSAVHPDRFAHLPESERRVSMQWATQVNEAYRTLRQPLSRAVYLLGMKGVDAEAESNTTLPPEFLIEQMEWREAVSEARAGDDLDELEQLAARIRADRAERVTEIAGLIDEKGDFHAAAAAVRRLMFVEKLAADIFEAIEHLE
jgi:molecular chaperone HscB